MCEWRSVVCLWGVRAYWLYLCSIFSSIFSNSDLQAQRLSRASLLHQKYATKKTSVSSAYNTHRYPNQEWGGRRGRESMFSPVSPWLYKRHVLKINPAVKRVCVCVCVSACMSALMGKYTHNQGYTFRLIWLNANTNTHCAHMPASLCSLWLPRRHSFLQLKRSKALAPHTHTHSSLSGYFLDSVC